MIQDFTRLVVADNTGAREAMAIKILGGSKRRYGRIGDVIIVTIKDAVPQSPIKPGDKARAVIIRQRKEYRRSDASYIRFDDNACVLIDEKGEPKGTRIFGPVPRELRERAFTKIISLASEVV